MPVQSDLQAFSTDWRRLRQQKHRMRGGTEARIITNLGMWYGEHYLTQARDTMLTRPLGKDNDKNKLWLVFNLFRKMTRRKIGRIWSVMKGVEFRATPSHRDPSAWDNAEVVDDLIRGLDFKLSEQWQMWNRLWWLLLGGVVVDHTPWIEDVTDEPLPKFDPESGELVWKDQITGASLLQSQVESLVTRGLTPERFAPIEELTTTGEVGSEIISPLNFFIDAATPTIRQLPPDGACYDVKIKTVGWVREVFGADVARRIKSSSSDLSIVATRLLDQGPSVANLSLRDLMPAIQGTKTPQDPPMCMVATRYQPETHDWPRGRRTIFVPDQVELDDDETPYGEIPMVDLHYEPSAATFWTGDFGTDLVPGQKFLNKRMSQLGESANASIYEVLMLGSELTTADIPSDMPGVIEDGLDEQGTPRVQVLQRGQLPQFFLESIKLIVEYVESVGAADLLAHRQFPGQLRGPLAIPMIQEVIDSEDGPFYSHLAEQLAKVKQMRVNRVKQFYPPLRTLHYTGRDMKNEVLDFHTQAILRAGTDYTVTIDPGTLLPELGSLRHARVQEDLQGPMAILYTNPRTGRLDRSRIAAALKYNDRGVLDREVQCRKLAQHLIKQLWSGAPLDPQIPFPFWDHDAMMDEYESAMETTEWLEASPPIRQAFLTLYDKHRSYLDAIQSAQAQAIQSQQMQSAVAQATQQTAAKVAAETVEAAIQQIREQGRMAEAQPPVQTVEAALRQRLGEQGRLAGGPMPVRPAVPASRTRTGEGRQGVRDLMGRG